MQQQGAGHDDQVSAEDHDRDPNGNNVKHRERDEGRREEKLVGKGIEICPQLCALIGDPCDDAVEDVGNACHNKRQQSPTIMRVDQESDKKWNEKDAENRQGIREVHGGQKMNKPAGDAGIISTHRTGCQCGRAPQCFLTTGGSLG